MSALYYKKQTYTLDSWGAGASYPLFNYNLAYKMQDYDDAHTQIVTRAGGVAQTAYGIGTAVGGGVTSCMGLATCGFGVVAGLYGLDHTLAGVKTIWTGKASQTAGEILFPRPSVWNKAQESFCMDLLILIL